MCPCLYLWACVAVCVKVLTAKWNNSTACCTYYSYDRWTFVQHIREKFLFRMSQSSPLVYISTAAVFCKIICSCKVSKYIINSLAYHSPVLYAPVLFFTTACCGPETSFMQSYSIILTEGHKNQPKEPIRTVKYHNIILKVPFYNIQTSTILV